MTNDDLFGESPPPVRKLTDKQRRRQAPVPKIRAHRIDLSDEVKAIHLLDEWGMLSDEAKKDHAEVLETAISAASREEFKQWRQQHGTDNVTGAVRRKD